MNECPPASLAMTGRAPKWDDNQNVLFSTFPFLFIYWHLSGSPLARPGLFVAFIESRVSNLESGVWSLESGVWSLAGALARVCSSVQRD